MVSLMTYKHSQEIVSVLKTGTGRLITSDLYGLLKVDVCLAEITASLFYFYWLNG